MDINYDSLFESVVSSLEEAKTQNKRNFVSYSNMMRFVAPKEVGQTNTYLLRVLPYAKEGNNGTEKTFHHYLKFFWEDEMGNKHSVLSRKTFNEQCPIDKYYWNVKTNGTQYEKEQIDKRLGRKEGWYCNVFVVNDPVNPANNGTVKVVSLNKTLYRKIDDAIHGRLDDEWSEQATNSNPTGETIRLQVGRMVLNLTDNGINLEVNVLKKGNWPNYDNSRFTYKERKLGLTKDQQEEILNQCQDVTTIEKEKSAEEIYAEFKESYLGEGVAPTTFKPDPKKPSTEVFEDEDDIPGLGKIDDDIPTFGGGSSSSTVEDVEAFAKSLNIGNL